MSARECLLSMFREAHARMCHCMPILDDDGNLVFTSRDDRCERFAAELTDLLARLDAPVTPGEPLSPAVLAELAAEGYVHRSMLRPSPPRSPEAKACEAWCGDTQAFILAAPVGGGFTDRAERGRYCTADCADAGRALNPRAAK